MIINIQCIRKIILSECCLCLHDLSCSICLLKHVGVLFISFPRNMMIQVIHKPNIGNAPAGLRELKNLRNP